MSNMANAISAIYRYPVKGLSAEKLDRVALTPGECLPHDRRFAIALGSTPFDPERPGWLSKTNFIMLMRDEKLAQLQTRNCAPAVDEGLTPMIALPLNPRVTGGGDMAPLLTAEDVVRRHCQLNSVESTFLAPLS